MGAARSAFRKGVRGRVADSGYPPTVTRETRTDIGGLPMKLYPFAIASAAVLGTAAVLVGSGTAATENANTTGQQLLINQRISQAAVRRSNSALNYLAPIRTTTSDAANTGKNGVTPLSKVAGAGQGWPTAAIANNAITAAKLATPVQAVVNNVHRIPVTKVAGGASATLATIGNVTVTGNCAISQTLTNTSLTGGPFNNYDIASVSVNSAAAGWSGNGQVVQRPAGGGAQQTGYVNVDNVGAGASTVLLEFGVPTTTVASQTLTGGVMRSDGVGANIQVTAGTNLTLGANGGVGSCTFSGVVNT